MERTRSLALACVMWAAAGPAGAEPGTLLEQARAAAKEDRVTDARRLYTEAVAQARPAGGVELAATLREQGQYFTRLGLFAEAEAALAAAAKALPEGDAGGEERAAVAAARSWWLAAAGRLAEACDWCGEQYRLRRDLARAAPADTARRDHWLQAGDEYAHALFDQGKDGPAEAILAECLKAATARPDDPKLVPAIALLENTRALVLKETGRWDEAERAYSAAVDAHRRDVARGAADARRLLAAVLRNRAIVREQLEQADAARRDADEARELELAIPPAAEHDQLRWDLEKATQRASQLLPMVAGPADPTALATRRKRAAENPDVPAFQCELLAALAPVAVQPGADADRQEAAIRELRDLAAGLTRRYPDVPAYRRMAIGFQLTLALDRLQRSHSLAEAQVAAALAEFDAYAASRPDDLATHRKAADTHANVAMAYLLNGRAADAIPELRASLDGSRRVAAARPESAQLARLAAVAGQNLAIQLYLQARWEEAEAALAENVGPWEELARKHPAAPYFRDQLARTYEHLAMARDERKKPAEARAAIDKARALREELVKQFPAERRYGHRLAQTHNLVAALRTHADDADGAVAAFTPSVDLLENMLKADPADSMARAILIDTLRARGAVYNTAGRFAEFSKDFDRAAALRR
jgi:hypothetical protein